MKKTWQKPKVEVAATGMEVTSYSSADVDSEIVIDPDLQF
ncbi:MAG: pyrroloquinoline quinone precursor peptide PqqA [Rhizobiaceae bacterium]